MSDLILATIIAGAFGLVGLFLKMLLRRSPGVSKTSSQSLQPARAGTLCGVWQGDAWDHSRRRGLPFPVVWDLSVNAATKEVKGRSTINYPSEAPVEFDLAGGLLYDHYCCILYRAREEGAIRFGFIIVRLGLKSDRLEGMFLGCSYRNPKKPLVCGKVELTKLVAPQTVSFT